MPLLTVLLAIDPAKAATIEVNPDACLAPGIACTIGEAVDAAASGDVIRWIPVADGAVAPAILEEVVVDGGRFAALTIESVAGPASTVWRPSAGEGTQVIVQNGAELTLRGFRFELGTDSCVRGDNSDLIIEESEFLACTRETNGGALFLNDGNLTITDSLFYQNFAGGNGGAVFFGGPSAADDTLVIERTLFEENRANDDLSVGGAVATRYVEDITVTESNFLGNVSLARGGGLSVEFGDELVAEDNTFQLNKSFFSLVEEELEEEDEGETVGLIYSTGQGGGLFFDGESVEARRNLFCGNLADDGGGIYGIDVDSAEYYNNIFAENWAAHFGGAVNSTVVDGREASEPTIINNTFLNNSAGLFPDPQVIVVYGAGGSISLDGSLADIRNNIIERSYFGGGIFAKAGELWEIGDPIAIEYNLMYQNCDSVGCTDESSQHFTSDLNAHAVSASNIHAPAQLVYYRPEGDCYTDAFYPEVGSPVIDAGDPTIVDAIVGGRSDIGAFGGPDADVKDDDGDSWVNIYDCHDLNPLINPTQADICDQVDNNCNGEIDEDFETDWYPDNDRDGFGDAEVLVPLVDCLDLGPALVTNNEDCDDDDPDVFPENYEVCDGKDNDCNLVVDDPDKLVFEAWVPDNDGDGFGESGGGTIACAPPADGWVNFGGDCDDTDATVNPAAPEICDEGEPLDNDCDGQIDEEPTEATAQWYLDGDGDGVGAGEPVVQCEDPGVEDGLAYVNEDGDCDDLDPTSFPAVTRAADGQAVPGGVDVCDGRDNDCNGAVDDDITQQTAWYLDADADGFGDNATALFSCDEPGATYVVKGGDCDDENPDIGECAECGCQAAPTSGSAGLLGLLGVMLLLRRRRD